ncbi:MAG TPA: deoxyribonuclease IV [Candidatus Paceibacterota bacterium]|nr:deoxyribonuclease IV [Candidatus Paceibacterota bacterium]
MKKIGCHVSIAGGIFNAPKRAADLGCEVFQIFSRSPQGGPAPELTPEIVEKFKSEMKANKQENCFIHTPYYINFASDNNKIRHGSSRIVREELERGSLIGAKYVMMHIGSAKGMTHEQAMERCAKGVARVMEDYDGTTELLLEISAGTGDVIGDTFEELEEIIERSGSKGKVGICLDTCHMFASGYDIRTEEGVAKTLETISNTVGKKSIKLIHTNDSKTELGGKRDRHDHIGFGKIGRRGFELMMENFDLDFILETEHDKVAEDILLLKEIRKAI